MDETGYAHRSRLPTTDILEPMSSLSGIPVAKRRRAAATVGLFAMLFVTIGVVAATGRNGSAAAPVFAGVSVGIAVVLALIAWGLVRSVSMDEAEHQLDAAILEALAERPEFGSLCSCGHDHDPTELHIPDAAHADHADACAHDGAGASCAHDCSTCVLAALRPSPTVTRAQRLTR